MNTNEQSSNPSIKQSVNPMTPYKTYLSESELPKAWYNVRADMAKKPAPLLEESGEPDGLS